jgi:hypothetical protein
MPTPTAREAEPPPGRCPRAARRAAGGFVRHLELELGRSPHTVRAYAGDVAALLEHAARRGVGDLAGLDLAVLRSWLARSRSTGRGPHHPGAAGGRARGCSPPGRAAAG